MVNALEKWKWFSSKKGFLMILLQFLVVFDIIMQWREISHFNNESMYELVQCAKHKCWSKDSKLWVPNPCPYAYRTIVYDFILCAWLFLAILARFWNPLFLTETIQSCVSKENIYIRKMENNEKKKLPHFDGNFHFEQHTWRRASCIAHQMWIYECDRIVSSTQRDFSHEKRLVKYT